MTPANMTALTSIDAVRRKILSLQRAADDAEDRAELLQMEADMERQGRKGVKMPTERCEKTTPPTGSKTEPIHRAHVRIRMRYLGVKIGSQSAWRKNGSAHDSHTGRKK